MFQKYIIVRSRLVTFITGIILLYNSSSDL